MSLNVQRGYPLGLDISTSEVQDNTVTLAKVAHHTGEGVPVYDAAGVPIALDGGAALEVLRMNAGGTALEYASPSGGKIELIGHNTISTASTDTFTGISGYKYLLYLYNVTVTNVTTLGMTFNNDTGNNYRNRWVSGTTWNDSAGAAHIKVDDTTVINKVYGGMFMINVEGLGGATDPHKVAPMMGYNQQTLLAGAWDGANDITEIDLDVGAGTMTGYATLYGIKET